jgi:phosphoglycolate phosphatase
LIRPGSIDLLIFDLDGTLIDSKQDLANAVNAARRHMGLAPIEDERVYSYVGTGAPTLIRRAMGPEASEETVQAALDFFLAYYKDHMLDHTALYPGVREALDAFLAGGLKMSVLTNKPVRFSQLLVEGLGLGGHFFRVYGGNSFEQKKPDPTGVYKLLEEAGAKAGRALMVGDSDVDILTARNAGILACGVTYGFQPETLSAAPPDILVNDLRQLAAMLLGGSATEQARKA